MNREEVTWFIILDAKGVNDGGAASVRYELDRRIYTNGVSLNDISICDYGRRFSPSPQREKLLTLQQRLEIQMLN